MARGIQGLPGWVWLYKNKPNPYGIQVETRTAYNPLSGDTLDVRDAQTMAHGGVSFEQRRWLNDGRSRSILDDYISAQATKGNLFTDGQAVNNPEFKQIVRDLKSEQGRTPAAADMKLPLLERLQKQARNQFIYPPNSKRAKALEKLGRRKQD